MANTLGLDDDFDGVELVQEVEKAFDVEIANAEAERTLVVGQLHDLLLSKIPINDTNKKCACAMTFYRLRQGMEHLSFGSKLTPSSDIGFLEKIGTRQSFKNLERDTGLALPEVGITWVGGLGCLIVLIAMASVGVAIIASLFVHLNWPFLSFSMLFPIAAVGVGFGMIYLDAGKLTADCRTLGGLAKKTATLNYGKLVKLGARNRSDDIWNILVDLLSKYPLPKSEITRETYFLRSQLKRSS